MRHFMAHDHGHFIVVQLQLIQDAGVKRNLATGHAPCVDLLAANQIHFPLPFSRIRVPLRCIGNQSGGDGAQAFELRVIVWRQRTFAVASPKVCRYCCLAEASSVSAGISLRMLEAWPTSTCACAVPAIKAVNPKPAPPS